MKLSEQEVENKPKKSWKWPSMKPLKHAINRGVNKIRSFRKNSKLEHDVNLVFSELRNTTFSRSLQKKYNRPDTSFARVEIFVDDFVQADTDGQFDIDKVLAALKNLNNLLL